MSAFAEKADSPTTGSTVLSSTKTPSSPSSGSGNATPTQSEAKGEDLAKQLSNPISSLISLPIKYSYEQDLGPDDEGERRTVTIQPVLPISITERWNMISRTIFPFVDLEDIPAGEDEFGLGDITQSLFFSPKEPTRHGLIWGAGPVFLLPTATEDTLGAEKWGIGPTFVGLKQSGPWTYGMLANHVWSVAGDNDREDVNSSFVQPFLAYVTKTQTTFSLNTESTYDWIDDEWSIPINLEVKQMLKVGKQPLQVGAGARYWADAPESGPEGWGFTASLTFLFPKR
jgi:hypothetical protein